MKNKDSLKDFLGKRVKLILHDNYAKTGTLESYDAFSLYIRYREGALISVNRSTIRQMSIKEPLNIAPIGKDIIKRGSSE